MQFLKKLKSYFRPKEQPNEQLRQDRSFLVFQQTGEVLRAERLLKEAGYVVEVMGPPGWLRTGCDLVLVCQSTAEPRLRQLLAKVSLAPEQVYPVSSEMLEPVSLYQIRDLGTYYMVRAANMKVTVEKTSGLIVNVSGGGCPDVPYLANCLLGQCVADCDEPALRGQTLCSYALQKAFLEARRLWLEQHGS
ncbi:MAG: DUF3343 domain-containing protein [Desulfovibrio sp.]|nr:DUF3343 domain-containing protein [Desulfovibrio sp.]